MSGTEPLMAALRWAAATPFPSRRFHVLLTLSQESFSPFPRGTCSLSVSPLYLVLDEVYHPVGTAVSGSPTRGRRLSVSL